MIETALAFAFPWAAYYTSEALELSGIVTIMFCGIVMASYARHSLSAAGRQLTEDSSQTAARIAETFVFVYLGMAAVAFPIFEPGGCAARDTRAASATAARPASTACGPTRRRERRDEDARDRVEIRVARSSPRRPKRRGNAFAQRFDDMRATTTHRIRDEHRERRRNDSRRRLRFARATRRVRR